MNSFNSCWWHVANNVMMGPSQPNTLNSNHFPQFILYYLSSWKLRFSVVHCSLDFHYNQYPQLDTFINVEAFHRRRLTRLRMHKHENIYIFFINMKICVISNLACKCQVHTINPMVLLFESCFSLLLIFYIGSVNNPYGAWCIRITRAGSLEGQAVRPLTNMRKLSVVCSIGPFIHIMGFVDHLIKSVSRV